MDDPVAREHDLNPTFANIAAIYAPPLQYGARVPEIRAQMCHYNQ